MARKEHHAPKNQKKEKSSSGRIKPQTEYQRERDAYKKRKHHKH